MQIRKGLVATATAAAVLTSGVTVAGAQTVNTDAKTVATQDNKSSSSSNDGKKMTAKEIQEWIAVATALVGLLGTLASFASKYLKP
ncbi:hypothetical protein M5J20_03080 [Corynebacterium sp. TA-R-1]|uniref:Secreted protein n=1 Tax=Corynebacterium stercoris TaxID=2943490 RepID=A0ABT1FZI2_9CORY|nr:hypothetical protein [Corynebacterium stercoris]MCP1387177.1 hypothetical protein [Corynebacterium stercoris]